MNTTCERQGEGGIHVECSEGRILPWTTFCSDLGECPVTLRSDIAITARCNHIDPSYCPRNAKSSKICEGSLTKRSIQDYCEYGLPCPSAKKGLEFQQCYNPYVLYTCHNTALLKPFLRRKSIFLKGYVRIG